MFVVLSQSKTFLERACMNRLRSLLGIVCCQLVVIVPGGLQKEDTFPVWPLDMATAINETLPIPATEEEIEASVVDLLGKINKGSSEHFLLFNWSEKSWLAGSADEGDVARVLALALAQKIDHSKQPLDVHLIAHSRGCYVVCEALRLLQNSKGLGFVKLTLLDAYSLGNDGTVEANPGGIVDWTENYYQLGVAPHGRSISGALNVNLSFILNNWQGRDFNQSAEHAEVHDWYHWTWDESDKDLKKLSYRDVTLRAQKRVFWEEAQKGATTTRWNLYQNETIVQNFNGDKATGFLISPYESKDVKIVERALQLTQPKTMAGGSLFAANAIPGNFTAEFTVRILPKKGSVAGDGMTFAMLDFRQAQRLGKFGGQLGYGGLSGLALAFDGFPNQNYGDPKDTASTISLRVGGKPTWRKFSSIELPEPINRGNKFRFRVSLKGRKLTILGYSFGQDEIFSMEEVIPEDCEIPSYKYVGFTASTGGAAVATHEVDDVIIRFDE